MPPSAQSCSSLGDEWTFANITQNRYICQNANAWIYWGWGKRNPSSVSDKPGNQSGCETGVLGDGPFLLQHRPWEFCWGACAEDTHSPCPCVYSSGQSRCFLPLGQRPLMSRAPSAGACEIWSLPTQKCCCLSIPASLCHYPQPGWLFFPQR